jgi:hypothetical protein
MKEIDITDSRPQLTPKAILIETLLISVFEVSHKHPEVQNLRWPFLAPRVHIQMLKPAAGLCADPQD